jgi:hypothetical protein
MTIQSLKMDFGSPGHGLLHWWPWAPWSSLKLPCRKTYNRSLQIPLKPIPMDSEHPKTPSWAFLHLVWPKNEEDRPPASFLLQACCLWFANSHLCVSNLASGHFLCLNPTCTPFPQITPKCRTVRGLAPKPTEVLDAWSM